MTAELPVTVTALRGFRAAHGLSISRLAALLGSSSRVTARWLAGREPAQAGDILRRLADLTEAPAAIGPPHGKPGRPRSRNSASQ